MDEAFQYQHVDLVGLMEREQHDEALTRVEEFFEANRHHDREGRLEPRVISTREFILWDAGRYAEALEACEARAQFGFDNVTDRWSLGSAKAKNLQALGRHEEALAAFEEAFSHQDPRYAHCAPYYLPTLAELYEGVGRPVDEKWREVALKAAEEYGIKMPVRKTLAKSMRVLNKLTGRMKTKRQKEWEKKNQGKVDAP